MTYQTGSLISASDYNNLIGGQGSSTAFASDVAASQKFAAIYGVGYGNRGFGQTTYSFAPKATGSTVTTLEWNNLVHAMYDVAFYTGAINKMPTNDWINAKLSSNIIQSTPSEFDSIFLNFDDFLIGYDAASLDAQILAEFEFNGEVNDPQVPDPNANGWIEALITSTTSDLNIPPLTQFSVGAPIIPQESSAPTNSTYDIDSHVAILDATRLNQSDVVRTITYNYFALINPSPVASLSNLSSTFSFDFGTSDNARYFFNSGGEIRLRLAHSSVAFPHDAYWQNIFANFGIVSFNGFNTIRSSPITFTAPGSNYGYYNIPTTNTLICSAVDANIPGLELYGMNDLQIYAKTSGASTNGGNGSMITFTITLVDQYTGTGDTMAAGFGVFADIVKASQYLSIQSPTPILNSAWA